MSLDISISVLYKGLSPSDFFLCLGDTLVDSGETVGVGTEANSFFVIQIVSSRGLLSSLVVAMVRGPAEAVGYVSSTVD